MIRIPVFTIAVLLLCTACIQFGREAKPTRHYLLAPVAATDTATNSEPIDLKLSSIEFPGYLDRPQIVTRNSENAIQIADFDRWAEPLPEIFSRTLKENLFRQLTGIRISTAPWGSNTEPDFELRLIVNRFDGILGDRAEVDIRWSLISAEGKELSHQHFQAQVPVSDSYQSLVAGLNKALAQLSEEIAAALRSQQKGR